MKITDLLSKQCVMLFDGGMGSELERRGYDISGISIINNPEIVSQIHYDYSHIGVDALIASTFNLNRIFLESHGCDNSLQTLNIKGIELAREVVNESQLVFGGIGPTGQMLEPYGKYTEKQIYLNYAEQVEVQYAAGANGLIIETFNSLKEAECALKACTTKTDLPAILSVSLCSEKNGGRTIMGDSIQKIVQSAESYNAAAVGANCGDLDLNQMATITKLFKEFTSLPVIIQPNAGKPKLIGKKAVYDINPEVYAEGMMQCIENGATIVGGCCGTTPTHMQKLFKLLGECKLI